MLFIVLLSSFRSTLGKAYGVPPPNLSQKGDFAVMKGNVMQNFHLFFKIKALFSRLIFVRDRRTSETCVFLGWLLFSGLGEATDKNRRKKMNTSLLVFTDFFFRFGDGDFFKGLCIPLL